jgi:hypothetical protein
MSISRSLAGAAAALSLAGVVGAQPMATQSELRPECRYTATTIPNQNQITSDACQKIADFAAFFAPILGTSLVGGNTTLAQGGTLGGLGHFTIGVRANVMMSGTLPNLSCTAISSSGARKSTIEVDNQLVGLPAVDAAIGIYRGFPLGVTNVGGVDLLFSATYIPEIDTDNADITVPGGSLKIGYGARIGLLQETLVMPGLGLSILKRDLPATTVATQSGDDVLEIRELKTNTTAWRLTASKSLLLFGLAAGVGQDKFSTSTTLFVNVNETVGGTPLNGSKTIPFSQDLTRTNYFVDLSLNLLVLKLVAEVGQVSGGDIATVNIFQGKEADASRTYFSVGARVGF